MLLPNAQLIVPVLDFNAYMKPVWGLKQTAGIPYKLRLRQNPCLAHLIAVWPVHGTNVLGMPHKGKRLTSNAYNLKPTNVKHKSGLMLHAITLVCDGRKIGVHKNKPRHLPRKLDARQEFEQIHIAIKIQTRDSGNIHDRPQFNVLTKKL